MTFSSLWRSLPFVTLLVGCTTIGHVPAPTDWPKLTVVEHQVKGGELLQKCYSALPLWLKLLGGIPLGCAWVDFSKMTCDIYVPEGTPEGDQVLLHEREHCDGKDHATDSTLADAWRDWKEAMTTDNTVYYYVRHDGVTVRAIP